MRRLPIIPTLIVVAAVATMIGLGIWQLQRSAWKEALLADYARAVGQPAVDLDPLLARGRPLPDLSFRRALVTCTARDQAVEAHAGRNQADATGQVFSIPCRPGASGPAGRLRINVGWANRPDAVRRLSLTGIAAGQLGHIAEDGTITLVAATPSPPLVASQPTGLETISNNHRLYAWQWFFFAAAALVIYVLALRKRNAVKLPPEP